LVLSASGSVYNWGYNDFGQLADGSTNNSYYPKQVVSIREAKQIAVGGSHSIALLSNGAIAVWGDNSMGQFGDGQQISSRVPIQQRNISDLNNFCGAYRSSLWVNSKGEVSNTGAHAFVISNYNSNMDLGQISKTAINWSK
jgi:alpha-tubulin suppressor-like RCC1 family protein